STRRTANSNAPQNSRATVANVSCCSTALPPSASGPRRTYRSSSARGLLGAILAAPDLLDVLLQRHLVERGERQAEEHGDAVAQHAERLGESEVHLGFV